VSDPGGKNVQIYASGSRNAAGIAFNLETKDLWAAVNERDDLGDVPSDF
jgi:glucose/arabinose dehydrogenase